VTNVDFGDWTDYLGDPPLVMALLDRVVDSSIIIKFDGTDQRGQDSLMSGEKKVSGTGD
jgi:hypothetical protein